MPRIKHRIVGDVSYKIAGGKLTLEPGWAAKNIVTVTVPALKGADVGGGKTSSGKVQWFKGAVYQLQKAFEEIEARGLDHLILSYAGSFYPRPIRGSTRTPSEHSFGTAFDINAAWNGLGREPAARGTKGSVCELVEIFERWGFRWGGDFRRRDGMHFEIARVITPADSIEAPEHVTKTNPVKQHRVFVNGNALKTADFTNSALVAGVRETLQAAGFTVHAVKTPAGGYDVIATLNGEKLPGILRAHNSASSVFVNGRGAVHGEVLQLNGGEIALAGVREALEFAGLTVHAAKLPNGDWNISAYRG